MRRYGGSQWGPVLFSYQRSSKYIILRSAGGRQVWNDMSLNK